jgi:hypothetical protein
MVKLPVIVYNRKTKDDVIYTAIDLRAKLEQFATEEQTKTGTYIRPIVLFQGRTPRKRNRRNLPKNKRKPHQSRNTPRTDRHQNRNHQRNQKHRPPQPLLSHQIHHHHQRTQRRMGLPLRLHPRNPRQPQFKD